MDQALLVTEQTDAGAELVRRFDKYAPIKAAFWIKASEESRWYLYIASDQFDDTNLDVAYGEVLRLAAEIGNRFLDPFQVNLVKTTDPLTQAALDINRRYPGTTANCIGGTNFGGMSVEGVFIYPATVAVTSP